LSGFANYNPPICPVLKTPPQDGFSTLTTVAAHASLAAAIDDSQP
jgi:hypothetical protein